MTSRRTPVRAILLAAMLLLPGTCPAQRLRGYRVQADGITVSGLSSGGFMAQQFHVAHSAEVAGAGIVAAGPYDCADSQTGWLPLPAAMDVCTHTMTGAAFAGPPDARASVAATRRAARQRLIDPPANLARSRVYLFSGTRDSRVPPSVVTSLKGYYAAFMAADHIALVDDVPAEHAMVTDGYGNACGHFGPPYVNDCGYDTAGRMLAFLYGGLRLVADPAGGDLSTFEQAEFVPAWDTSMARLGHLFVPAGCEGGGCRLHIAFHGCLQDDSQVGDAFYAHAGYNRWAAGNRIVVLYPQVTASPANPKGCWDFWGYTDPWFATRRGRQITAVQKMVRRLAGG